MALNLHPGFSHLRLGSLSSALRLFLASITSLPVYPLAPQISMFASSSDSMMSVERFR